MPPPSSKCHNGRQGGRLHHPPPQDGQCRQCELTLRAFGLHPLCPMHAACRHVARLQRGGAPPNSPLFREMPAKAFVAEKFSVILKTPGGVSMRGTTPCQDKAKRSICKGPSDNWKSHQKKQRDIIKRLSPGFKNTMPDGLGSTKFYQTRKGRHHEAFVASVLTLN